MIVRGTVALALAVLVVTGCAVGSPQGPVSKSSPPPPCTVDANVPGHDLDEAPAGYISYDRLDADIRTPVTKFGGQPVWLEKPRWPIAKTGGQQMVFVGQIALDRFPGGTGKLAYLFVAQEPDPVGGFYVFDNYPKLWDPFGGDNAVIIEPGGRSFVPTTAQATGPTVESETKPRFEDVYAATLDERTDPAFIPDDRLASLTDDEWKAYADPAYKDKVGGTPIFIQPAEFPGCGEFSTLALQLSAPPFYLNLGDGGSGFLFLNDDASAGTWVTQSH